MNQNITPNKINKNPWNPWETQIKIKQCSIPITNSTYGSITKLSSRVHAKHRYTPDDDDCCRNVESYK